MDMNKYLAELSRVLKKEGFEVAPVSESELSVLLNGAVACRVGGAGALFQRPEDLHTEEANEIYHQVAPFSKMVSEYMREMERGPVLKASGLSEQVKLLADFGGSVLAGQEMERGAGMQFVTWLWDYDRAGVTLGHYFGDDYQAAKKDFALRSGLTQEEKKFTPEQLVEIYRCCTDTLTHEYELTYEQEKRIEGIQTQIIEMVPDLDERLKQALGDDASHQMQQTM